MLHLTLQKCLYICQIEKLIFNNFIFNCFELNKQYYIYLFVNIFLLHLNEEFNFFVLYKAIFGFNKAVLFLQFFDDLKMFY